jgi:hypothetical protein
MKSTPGPLDHLNWCDIKNRVKFSQDLFEKSEILNETKNR